MRKKIDGAFLFIEKGKWINKFYDVEAFVLPF
jgi:hypothetical protein